MNYKSINTILLSVLTITPLFSTEIKPQELTAKQLQTCIYKAEELAQIKNLIEKRKVQTNQFATEIKSFETSLTVIHKYIDSYQNKYKDESQELSYKEFELEELNKETQKYNKVQKRISELENIINKYTSTKYYQGLITTKQTLMQLIKDGNKYSLKAFEQIHQNDKKYKKHYQKIFEECITNKTVNPKIEKQVCEQNKNSALCAKYR